MFAGQEKSSIDKYAGISSLNSGVFSAQSPKYRQICIHFTNWFNLKVFNGHEKAILTAMPEHFCWSRDFFLGQNAEKFERYCEFFSEPIFPRSVSWTSNNGILTTLLQRFRRKTKFYRLKAENDRKFVSFSRETIFCEKLLLTQKRQFWLSFRYNFCCSQVFFLLKVQKLNKRSHFSSKGFSFES